MPEAVVAGHISLDLFPSLYEPLTFEPGRLVVVGPATVSTGGAVANVGVALHRLGVDVGLVAKVGGDLFGRAVLEALGKRLAPGIALAPAEVTSYTIVINPPVSTGASCTALARTKRSARAMSRMRSLRERACSTSVTRR